LYGYTAAKRSVEIPSFVPVHPIPDEKIAAVFEHAAEPIIASFANQVYPPAEIFTSRNGLQNEQPYKKGKDKKLRPGNFG
jgi:hypothetical protein